MHSPLTLYADFIKAQLDPDPETSPNEVARALSELLGCSLSAAHRALLTVNAGVWFNAWEHAYLAKEFIGPVVAEVEKVMYADARAYRQARRGRLPVASCLS